MNVTCTYCGYEGEYQQEIEIRRTARGEEVFACIDVAACDARDTLRAQREEETEEEGQ